MKTAAYNQHAYDVVQELLGGADALSNGLQALPAENLELAREVYDGLTDRLTGVDDDFARALNRLRDVITHPKDTQLGKNNLGKALSDLGLKTPVSY